MEEYIGYIVVGLGYLIWAGIRAASKKSEQGNKASQINEKDKGISLAQSSDKESRKNLSVNELIERLTQIRTDEPKKPAAKAEKHWLDMEENEKEEVFLTNEIDSARESHYSEDNLIEQYNRSHAAGKPIPHHSHSTPALEELDLADVGMKFDYDAERPPQRHINPLMDKLKDKKRLREAFILKEILDRKY